MVVVVVVVVVVVANLLSFYESCSTRAEGLETSLFLFLSLFLFPFYVPLSGWTLSGRTFNDISVSRKQKPLKTNVVMRDI